MTDIIKYRIYCETEDQYVSAWASEPLTACPNNAQHVANSQTTQELDIETGVLISLVPQSTSNQSYTKLYGFNYDSNVNGYFRRLQMNAYVDGDSTAFSIKAFDYTNQTTLFENTTIENTNAQSKINVGTTGVAPEGSFFLEIFGKVNDGTGSLHVDEIQLTASSTNN
jgi:hypothetical protein